MKMKIFVAAICSLLISCATMNLGGDPQPAPEQTPATEGTLGAEQSPAAAPTNSPDIALTPATTEPAGDSTFSSPPSDIGDSGSAKMEAQAAEHQETQADAMNEQRSTNELDAAAPETQGTDSFYASSQQPPASPEVDQVVSQEKAPTELPEKKVASWSDRSASSASADESAADTKYEKAHKSKKHAKKQKHVAKHSAKKNHKKIAKKSSKSKMVAKHGKKSKTLAKNKKSKMDCKKIAKHTKKASKREVAMCKAEQKKLARHKSKKMGKVAQAGCQCNIR
jgi:hypothetical protein